MQHNLRYRETEAPPFEKDLATPNEIISRTRAEFAETGSRNWKGLPCRKTSEVASQLEQHSMKRTVWLCDLLSEARQPGLEAETPIEFKSMLMDHVNFIAYNENARRQSILLLRASAKHSEDGVTDPQRTAYFIAEFNGIIDYAAIEPEAAARANSWTGIVKTSRKWHKTAKLRKVRDELESELI